MKIVLAVCLGFSFFFSTLLANADYVPTYEQWSGITVTTSEDAYKTLKDNRKYPIHNMFDGDSKTAWVFEGKKKPGKDDDPASFPPFDHGRNHWVEIAAQPSSPTRISVDKIGIINGYAKSNKIYARNNRILQIEILVDDKVIKTADLKETSDIQFVEFPEQDLHKKAVRIRFKKIAAGKDDDLCVSEISLFYKGKPVKIAKAQRYLYNPGDDCGCADYSCLIKPDGKLCSKFASALKKISGKEPLDACAEMSPDNKYLLFFVDYNTAGLICLYDVTKKKMVLSKPGFRPVNINWTEKGVALEFENENGNSKKAFLDFKKLTLEISKSKPKKDSGTK